MTLNAATLQLFQSIETPILTQFFRLISIIAEPIVVLIVAMAISVNLYLTKRKSKAILLASTSIFAGIVVTILKKLIKSPRPLTCLVQETSYSFPSGHTTFAVVFCGLMVYLFSAAKNRTQANILAVLTIFIVALSRLYLQVHWLTDIIGGLVIGSAILTLAIFIDKK